MTEAQAAAFHNASGYTPPELSLFWLGVLCTLALLYAAWALHTLYRGWASDDLSFRALGATTARVAFLLLVLMYFTLS